jgi:hypothetical protein
MKQLLPKSNYLEYVIIQHDKITVRIQDEVLALRTYYNSYLGADKARSASDRPATRDAQHPESGVLNSYNILAYCSCSIFLPGKPYKQRL